MKNLLKSLDCSAEAKSEIKGFGKEIESLPEEQRLMIIDFVEKDLSEYTGFLASFRERIKISEGVDRKLFFELKQQSDNIIQKGESLTKELKNKLFEKRLRRFFRIIVSPWPYKSIIMEKGFEKHRGYPGDYEMMDYVYNNKTCSGDIYGQYFDTYFIDNAYSEAVRGRKNLMRKILLEETEKGNDLRILNIPCGPARDVQEFLEEKGTNNGFQLLCIDNDNEALSFSKKSTYGLNGSENVIFKQGNILDYSRNPSKAGDDFGAFDIVYSIGIADYFPDKLLQKFIYFTYGLIKPGGKLIFAFKITDKDPFAPLPPKWFCDWLFVPRNLEESINVLEKSGIKGFTKTKETWEESGRIIFLEYEKE